jgi:catechol 2,3-dioxygenase-like lactoylglutathione lyase family enzyme
METMLEFYRDTLGFEVSLRAHSDDDTLDTEAIRTLVGIEDADLEIAFLDAPGCAIELIRYEDPSGHAPEIANDQVGAHHFAFAVADVGEWYDRLEATSGVETVSPPQDFGFTPRFYAHDPEGNVVELLEAE